MDLEKQENTQQEPEEGFMAEIGSVTENGVTLILDGAEEPTEKEYRVNMDATFSPGDRVFCHRTSGSFVVSFRVGAPGGGSHGIPPGGSTGQVLQKSSGTDYAVEWGTISGLIPSGGAAGQVLKKTSATSYAVEWGDVTVSGTLPTGGTTGQFLKKTGAADYAAAWADLYGVPAGGITGQVLKKASNTDYSLTWGDVSVQGTLPTGGSSGQVLKKDSSTNYDVSWTDLHGIPSGGSSGQVLAKNSSVNYDVHWESPSASALSSGTNKLTLSTKTLTPSATGFQIGTSTYQVKYVASTIEIYYNSYTHCTLACNSSGKLTVNGTVV